MSKSVKAKNKARAIAQDALKQIQLGVLIPSKGMYFQPANDPKPNQFGQSLQKLMQNQEVECKVCALGALFASKVSLDNKCSLETAWYLGSSGMRDALGEAFLIKELQLIEATFELWAWGWEGNQKANDKITKQIHIYGLQYKDPTQRLKAILRNIARNGEFKFPLWIRLRASVTK